MSPALRPYQEEDVKKLISKDAMACFNDMRTGKTPTALAAVKARGCTKVLIICPASAVLQWKEEFELWMEQPCVALIGTKAKREALLKEWTHGLVVSYDTFKRTKANEGEVLNIIKQNPDAVIADECHRFKNHKSANFLAMEQVIKVPYKLALSGTPAPNKAYEIYSTLHWLYPTTFPSYWKFISEYFRTAQRPIPGQRRMFIEITSFKPGMKLKLQKLLALISTQRKRKDVMQWLPEKDYQKVKLEPTKEQKKYLKELTDYFETGDIVVQGVLDRLIRYRQICLHPGLIGLKGSSPKLEWILQYLEDYPERSIIIFTKFTSFIKILSESLNNIPHGVIIGDTTLKDRNQLKKDFQNGKFKVLIINIDAGKEALTLDKAEVIIFTDKYPPVSDIQQAEDRFIATSEEKANKLHIIIDLIMKGTYDEQIHQLINQRKSETDIINNYKKYLKGEK